MKSAAADAIEQDQWRTFLTTGLHIHVVCVLLGISENTVRTLGGSGSWTSPDGTWHAGSPELTMTVGGYICLDPERLARHLRRLQLNTRADALLLAAGRLLLERM